MHKTFRSNFCPLQIDLDDVVAINPDLFTSPVITDVNESLPVRDNVTTQVCNFVIPLMLAEAVKISNLWDFKEILFNV